MADRAASSIPIQNDLEKRVGLFIFNLSFPLYITIFNLIVKIIGIID